MVLSPLDFPLHLLGLPSPTSILLRLLSLGPVPRHIAFIMDGNRRWARSQQADVRHGHMSGFGALKNVLEACLGLEGLKCVTVYAFAIDNFNRAESEVQALMDLMKSSLMELAGHGEIIARHSVRLRIVGRRELLPPDVRAAVEKVESATKGNSRATLNVCIPYSSRDEIATAVRTVARDRLRQHDRTARKRARDGTSQHRPLTNGEQSRSGYINGTDNFRSSTSPPPSPISAQAAASLAGVRNSDSLAWDMDQHDGSREMPSVNGINGHLTNGHSSSVPVYPSSRHRNDKAAATEWLKMLEDGLDSGPRYQSTDYSVTEEELNDAMMLQHSPPLDILVRTSGVRRLSDFMLWQCNEKTQLVFVDRYWPLFGLRELIPILLDYQRARWAERLREMWGGGDWDDDHDRGAVKVSLKYE